jgi:hypothetical protein
MADWLTHSLVGWITGKTSKQDIALLVVGSLIPDLVKINLAFTWLGINDHQFFNLLHTPVGTFLVAGIIALFFPDIKKALIPLGIGVSTHLILDFFLVHTHGGMKLLFPFSWDGWRIYLIRMDDYRMTIVAVLAALIAYLIYWIAAQRMKQKTVS